MEINFFCLTCFNFLIFFSSTLALVDAGSRYEVDYPSGVSHMLEKMAFQVYVRKIVDISLLLY